MNKATESTIGAYNAIADSYAANIEEYYVPEHREEFLSLIPKGGKILDAGCAAGRDSRVAASR